MRDVHKRQNYLAQTPSLPSAERMTGRQDTEQEAETKESRGVCDCNAQREVEVLRRENQSLRMDNEALRRKKDAKKMEHQEKERELKEENKRLWTLLERAVIPAGSPRVSPPGPSPTLH